MEICYVPCYERAVDRSWMILGLFGVFLHRQNLPMSRYRGGLESHWITLADFDCFI